MVKPTNLMAIEKATQRSWPEWLVFLDGIDAKSLDHTNIAAKVFTELNGKIDSAGWWAQGVTVAYEQHIGRRQPGQRSDGSYEFSVTRVVNMSREEIFAVILDKLSAVTQINEVRITHDRTSVTPVRSYWRADLDETRVSIAVEAKAEGKSLVAVTQSEFPDDTYIAEWRSFWKEWLNRITEE